MVRFSELPPLPACIPPDSAPPLTVKASCSEPPTDRNSTRLNSSHVAISACGVLLPSPSTTLFRAGVTGRVALASASYGDLILPFSAKKSQQPTERGANGQVQRAAAFACLYTTG